MQKVSGGEIFLERVLENLHSSFTFSVIAPPGKFSSRLLEKAYSVYSVKSNARLNREQGAISLNKYLGDFASWLVECVKIVKKGQFDLIVANSWGMALQALVLSSFTGKKYIWLHLHPIMDAKSKSAKVVKVLSLRCAAIACCSRAVKDSLILCGVKETKIQVIYAGVNTDKYAQAAMLENVSKEFENSSWLNLYAAKKKKITLSLISVIVPWKGHKYLIEAINLLPDYIKEGLRVDIVGSVINQFPTNLDYEQELHQLVNTYRLNDIVFFKGFIDDLGAYYHDIDLLLNCSQEPEPQGNTIVEAMANSKIAVVMDHGGSPELVVDRISGFIADHKQSSSLAAIITKVCSSLPVTELLNIQRNARKRAVECFDVRADVKKLEEIFQATL